MSFYSDLEKFKDNTCAINSEGEALSYGGMVAECRLFGESLKTKTSPLLILIFCRNNLETLMAYLASLRSGNTVILVNGALDESVFQSIKKNYMPDYIWQPRVESEAQDACFSWNDYVLIENKEPSPAEIHSELRVLLSTSGSTGSPKFVRLNERNISSNTESIADYLHLNASDRPITTLPMSYSYGLSIVNSHLLVGATLLLTDDSLVTKEFWAFFRDYSATSLAGVPYTYEMLIGIRFFRMALPSLKTMTQAGGKLSSKISQEFAAFCKEKEAHFYLMYGQTEATARMAYLDPEEVLSRPASIGKSIPGGKIELLDQEEKLITRAKEIGEIVYSGDNVMMGYAEDRLGLSGEDELGGRLHTGDLAYRDSDGFLYITGRKKRFIKMFGNRVNLEEMDSFLEQQGYTCASGGADNYLQIVHTNTGCSDEIKQRVIQQYGFNHAHLKVTHIDVIPRNDSGKIRYKELFAEVVDRES